MNIRETVLREDVEKLQSLRNNIATLRCPTVKISSIQLKTGWSDAVFTSRYGTYLLASVTDDQALPIIRTWVNVFYSDRIGKVDIGKLVYWAVSCLPAISDELASVDKYTKWKDNAEGLSQFLKTAPAPQSDPGASTSQPQLTGEELASLDQRSTVVDDSVPDLGGDPVQQWMANARENVLPLRCLVAFQALVTVRFISKSRESVQNYYNGRFTEVFKQLFPSHTLTSTIPGPSSKFLDVASLNIQRGTPDSVMLLASIINAHVAHQAAESQIRKVLEASCLLHTRANGMGLLSLTFAVMERWNLDFQALTDLIVSSSTLKSLTAIYDHLKAYTDKDEKTWWWARLLDDGYFANLTIKDNLLLSVRLAKILEHDQPSIFNIVALANAPLSMKEAAFKLAEKIVKQLSAGDQDRYLGIIDLARSVLTDDLPQLDASNYE